MRNRLGVVLIVAVAGACRNGEGETVGPRTDYGAVVRTLEPFIRHEMADKDLPGLSIALVDGEETVWATGFGFANPADSTPATAETVYRVGSIAKLVTAIGVMQLVENGKVALDSPVTKYLPDFHPTNRFGTPITVRELLSHRSGLVREPPVGSYFDSSRSSLADAVASLNGTEVVYAPGSQTKYSDAGMTVAGYLVEQVTGRSFVSAIEGAVLGPMELSHSTFTPDLSLDRALARGFLWTYDGRTTPAPRFAVGAPPATGLYSTVTDLARLTSVILTGGQGRRGRILKPETIASMRARAPTDSVGPAGLRLGLGLWIYEGLGIRRAGHAATFGGYTTELTMIPDARLGAIVVTTKDASNAVASRIANTALTLMEAAQEKRPFPPLATTTPITAELAKRLDGIYGGSAGRRVELDERNGRLVFHRRDDEVWLQLRSLGDTLIVDDRLARGERVLPLGTLGDAVGIGRDTLARISVPRPAAVSEALRGLVGEYGPDFNIVYLREEGGRLHLLVNWFFDYPLTGAGPDAYRLPDGGLYSGERVAFSRGPGGRGKTLSLGGVSLNRRSIAPEDGSTFKIIPLRPAEDLVREALAATPPKETGEFLKPDLVEVARLDPTIKLDMRYATTNNFVGTAFYKEGRAFAQRPAAEALVRANRRLRQQGYGLLIHDSYRPWYVTKMFWEATPEDKRIFVANPANGSRHNRGCAIDLTLYDLRTGKPIEMVSGYDEFSDRAYPDYPGGTSLQRWHRKLLRRAMEAEGFTVFSAEWWHFDYQDWRKYPILNVRFEEIGNTRS